MKEQSSIINPQQIEEILAQEKLFFERRERLAKVLNEAYSEKTPPAQVKKRKDGYDYVEYSWMLARMNELHPRRTETIVPGSINYDSQSHVFSMALQVTDLESGESRVGVGLHPIVIYEEGTDKLKHPKTIRALMNNAYKAALTLAQRHAWSNFGISSDIYKSQVSGPPTDVQQSRFEALMNEMQIRQDAIEDPITLDKAKEWMNTIHEQWSNLTESVADEFLNKLAEKTTKSKKE